MGSNIAVLCCNCSVLFCGADYDVRVLPSIVNEVTKAVVAQYNAAELLTKREIVSKQVRDLLVKRSADFKILLDDVAITHLSFSKEYTAAVEAKQVAQQDSERAKYIVERALQEKKSIVIRAEGEAKSAELIGNVSPTKLLFGVWNLVCYQLKQLFQCRPSVIVVFAHVHFLLTSALYCLWTMHTFVGYQEQPRFLAAPSH